MRKYVSRMMLIGALLALGSPLTIASAANAAPSASSSGKTACWSEVGSTRDFCVDGSPEALRTAVLHKFGVVMVTDPAKAQQEIAAGNAELKAYRAAQSQTATPESTVAVAPQAVAATYILGIFYDGMNYNEERTKTFTAPESCSTKTHGNSDLFAQTWGTGGGVVFYMNDAISSFKPGGGCKVALFADADYQGSKFGNYSTNQPNVQFMNDQASSIKWIAA